MSGTNPVRMCICVLQILLLPKPDTPTHPRPGSEGVGTPGSGALANPDSCQPITALSLLRLELKNVDYLIRLLSATYLATR